MAATISANAATGPSSAVPSARWALNYQGVNITSDISSMVVSLAYTDRLSTGLGDAEIVLADGDRRWQSSWYPGKGDVVNLKIGYDGAPLMPCGDFQVDEIALAGPPDRMHLRCIAAFITSTLRTRRSFGYEGMSLLEIAAMIAARHELSLIGSTAGIAAITFARVTQNQETDLGFLHRIAGAYGYDFNVRGRQLVFYARAALEQAASAATLCRGSVTRFAFHDKSNRIYGAATLAYQNLLAKQLIAQSAFSPVPLASADTLTLNERVESAAQAAIRTQAALHERNRMLTTCSLAMPGNPLIAAGGNINLAGWGSLDGVYLMETVRHRIGFRDGYVTELEGRRVS